MGSYMNIEQLLKVTTNFFENKFQNYAIAINGDWGSGKTFFWYNTITEKIKERKSIPIYVSVGGIENMEVFESKLLEALLLNINQDTEHKKFLKSFSGPTKKITQSNNSSLKEDHRFIISLVKNIGSYCIDYYIRERKCNNVVLCIDDLERTELKYEQLFSYLDSIIQRTQIKVVVLVNESHIKLQCDYKKNKEKLIRFTYHFKPNYDEVFTSIYKNLEKNSVKFDFLKEYESYIIDLFKEYNLNNVRTLLYFVDSLLYIYSYIDKSNDNDTSFKSIILLTLILSIETKQGKLTMDDAGHSKNLSSISFSFMRSRRLNTTPTKKISETQKAIQQHVADGLGKNHNFDYADEICRNYLQNYIHHYFFYDSIYQYILIGYLDKESLNREIQNHSKTKLLHEDIWDKLVSFEYGELEKESIDRITDEFLKFLQDGLYQKYVILESTRILSVLLINNLIQNKKDKILTSYENAVNALPVEVLDVYEVYHEGNDNIVLPEVKNMINKRMEKEDSNTNHAKRELFLSLLRNEMSDEERENFASVFYTWDNFHKAIQPKDIVSELRLSEDKNIVFLRELLQSKYNCQNIDQVRPDDKDFLTNLYFSLKIENIASGGQKFYFLSELKKELEKILTIYGVDISNGDPYL